jgi:excisionase family DNA binding protein/YgiT-type zinc finger domain-containing protein
MHQEKVDIDKQWKGRMITFRGIEANVCENCGTRVYEASDVSMMEALVESTLNKSEYPEVMNVEEVSRFLRITPQSVYNMLRDGRVSATKIGREWRFSKDSIMNMLNMPEQAICYRSSESGADKVNDEIEKYRAELRSKDNKKKENENDH